MLKLTRYAMYDNEIAEELLIECDIKKDDIQYLDVTEYDYSDVAIVNENTKEILYFNDNTHGYPDDFLEGFEKCLKHLCVEYKLDEKATHIDEFRKKYNYNGRSCR